MRVLSTSIFLLLFLSNISVKAIDLLYVSLPNNTVVAYDVSQVTSTAVTSSVRTVVSTNLNGPRGLAFDSLGNLYVANNSTSGNFSNTISKFDKSGNFLNSIGAGNINYVQGLAIDSVGNLYAANGDAYGSINANTISKFNSTGTFVSSFGSGYLNYPFGITFDSFGKIYVSNVNSNSISKFDVSGNYISSIGSSSNINTPTGITFDNYGDLYVSNSATSGAISNSVSKFNSNGNYLTAIDAHGYNPGGIVFDSAGNFYVANCLTWSISKFNSSGVFQFSWSTGQSNCPIFMTFNTYAVPESSNLILAMISALILYKKIVSS